MAAGVDATWNSGPVALLTPASVAWADSTTATSKVYGSTCLSSPRGSGLAAAKRRNAVSISSAVHALIVLPAATAAMAALGGRRTRAVVARRVAFLVTRALRGRSDFAARALRSAAPLRRAGARLRRVVLLAILSV